MFRIYVGNISYKVTAQTQNKLFSDYGLIDEIIYVTDEKTGKPRGFAFVLMPSEDQGRAAIASLDGRRVNGRPLVVGEASGKGMTKPTEVVGASTDRPTPSQSRRPVSRGARAGRRPGQRRFRGNQN